MELGIDDLLDKDKVAQAQNAVPSENKVKEIQTEQPKEEIKVEAPIVEKPTIKTPEQPKFELNNELVLDYINKDREQKFTSFEDLYKQPETKEVVKEVNPYEDVMDDYVEGLLKFKKETGLSKKEFDFVQQDFSQKSSLDFAYDRIRKDNPGMNLTEDQMDKYLEKTLDIDLSREEIDPTDMLNLNSFVKSYKDEQLGLQTKYKTTVSEKKATPSVEMVTLQNGEQMEKSKYDQLVNQNQKYINNLKQGVSSATSFDVEFAFDNNGEKQTSKLTYEYSEADKHSMLLNASDVDGLIGKLFRTEKGLDHQGLAMFVDKAVNSEKYLALAYNQGRAEALEEKIANDNNEQFGKPRVTDNQVKADSVDSLMGLM